MNDNSSDTQDVSDAALERAGVFGYDETGSKHSYDSVRGQVIVQDGDTVEHVEQLGNAALPKWIAFVRERRGWIDVWLGVDDAGEAMERHRIAEARAADEQYEQAKQEASA